MEYSRKLHEAGNVDAAGYVMWAASIVDKQPTIDPVKQGKVVTTTDEAATYHQNCSECGEEFGWKEYPNYCKNCGARMDGE